MVKPPPVYDFSDGGSEKKSQFGNVLLTAKLSQLRTTCTYKIIKYENNYLSICEYQGGVGIIF